MESISGNLVATVGEFRATSSPGAGNVNLFAPALRADNWIYRDSGPPISRSEFLGVRSFWGGHPPEAKRSTSGRADTPPLLGDALRRAFLLRRFGWNYAGSTCSGRLCGRLSNGSRRRQWHCGPTRDVGDWDDVCSDTFLGDSACMTRDQGYARQGDKRHRAKKDNLHSGDPPNPSPASIRADGVESYQRDSANDVASCLPYALRDSLLPFALD